MEYLYYYTQATPENVEETIGYFKPINYKTAVICTETCPFRGKKMKLGNDLHVYMNSIEDYKGDIFDTLSLGKIDENNIELVDYLVSTGKLKYKI